MGEVPHWRTIDPAAAGVRSGCGEHVLLIALALFGLVIAIYLALYQLGIIPVPWDPIFGSTSSERVLHSFIARTLPVPDATFGALGYLSEVVLLAAVGGHERWRLHPWVVVLYGLVVLGMGLVSIGLVLMQAFVVQSWCTLCLLSAATSLTILAVASREVLTTLRYLQCETEQGRSLRAALLGPSSQHSHLSP